MAAAPAFADNAINYYNGSGTGQALNLSVDPQAVVNVNLDLVNQLVSQLPLGLNQTLNNLAGSTLKNPTAPIGIVVDAAHSEGVAQNGTQLTGGSAYSTPVSIDAAALVSELQVLHDALQNIPTGTVGALNSVVKPTTDALGLSSALDQVKAAIAPISDALGHPSVNLVQSISASFGQNITKDVVDVDPGLLTGIGFHLDPFNARAIPADAHADNKVTSLDVLPSKLGNITAAAGNLTGAISNLQNLLNGKLGTSAVTGTASSVPVVGSVIGSTLGGVLGTLPTASLPALPTGNVVPATNIPQIDNLLNSLGVLNSDLTNATNLLELNDILGNGPSTALGNLVRDAAGVHASGLSQLVRADVLKFNNPILGSVLQSIFPNVPKDTALLSVQGIKGTANVDLDGKNNAVTTADSKLAEVDLLGQPLITSDTLLPQGTSCTVKLPGGTTCSGNSTVGAILQLTNVTAPLAGVLQKDPLITITLTRGAPVFTSSAVAGSAKITALEIKVDLNLEVLKPVADILQSANLPLTLGKATQGTANLTTLDFGVAAANASLTPAVPPGGSNPPVSPPNTGNNILPLAILAAALAAGAAGIGARRIAFARA